jgi:hypothetical protein
MRVSKSGACVYSRSNIMASSRTSRLQQAGAFEQSVVWDRQTARHVTEIRMGLLQERQAFWAPAGSTGPGCSPPFSHKRHAPVLSQDPAGGGANL